MDGLFIVLRCLALLSEGVELLARLLAHKGCQLLLGRAGGLVGIPLPSLVLVRRLAVSVVVAKGLRLVLQHHAVVSVVRAVVAVKEAVLAAVRLALLGRRSLLGHPSIVGFSFAAISGRLKTALSMRSQKSMT